MTTDPRIELVKSQIRDVPNFPKPGILFKDITPLLAHPKAFNASLDLLGERLQDLEADTVVGMESRGFIFDTRTCIKVEPPKQLMLVSQPL